MIILLISIVYLLSVIGWFFIIWHKEKQHCYTIGDVLDEMADSPFFIPIANTLCLIIWGICYIVASWKLLLPFYKLWNKIRNIKIN